MIRQVLVFFLVVSFFWVQPAWADKAKVVIEAPETARYGEQVVIKIHVSHSANNFLHFTEKAYLKINNIKLVHWKYDLIKRPSAALFTIEHTIEVKENLTLEAAASCNVHGSAGLVKAQIKMTK